MRSLQPRGRRCPPCTCSDVPRAPRLGHSLLPPGAPHGPPAMGQPGWSHPGTAAHFWGGRRLEGTTRPRRRRCCGAAASTSRSGVPGSFGVDARMGVRGGGIRSRGGAGGGVRGAGHGSGCRCACGASLHGNGASASPPRSRSRLSRCRAPPPSQPRSPAAPSQRWAAAGPGPRRTRAPAARPRSARPEPPAAAPRLHGEDGALTAGAHGPGGGDAGHGMGSPSAALRASALPPP